MFFQPSTDEKINLQAVKTLLQWATATENIGKTLSGGYKIEHLSMGHSEIERDLELVPQIIQHESYMSSIWEHYM